MKRGDGQAAWLGDLKTASPYSSAADRLWLTAPGAQGQVDSAAAPGSAQGWASLQLRAGSFPLPPGGQRGPPRARGSRPPHGPHQLPEKSSKACRAWGGFHGGPATGQRAEQTCPGCQSWRGLQTSAQGRAASRLQHTPGSHPGSQCRHGASQGGHGSSGLRGPSREVLHSNPVSFLLLQTVVHTEPSIPSL